MNRERLDQLARDISWSGDPRADMIAFLHAHGCPRTAAHCLKVGEKARELAERVGVDPARAERAGWLHDISAPIPDARRVEAAQEWGLEILPEEVQVPMLLHQKLSAVLARELFGVDDEGVLSAIGCHTTLKAGASLLDKAVFLADKIAWDQPGAPPYLEAMLAASTLDASTLDAAIGIYFDHLWAQRAGGFVPHPWFQEAYAALRASRAAG